MPDTPEDEKLQGHSPEKALDKAIDGSLNAADPGNPLAGPATTEDVPSEKTQSKDAQAPAQSDSTEPDISAAPSLSQNVEAPKKTNGTALERLNQSFDVSSEKNRNLMFTFMAAQLYMLAAVGGTTDINLLLPNSNFVLPVVNIPLPLTGFYLFAPLLLVALHFAVLLNMSRHVALLKQWREHSEHSNFHVPFILNQLSDTASQREKTLVRFVCNAIFVTSPFFILIFFQTRFADYHSVGISRFHFGLVISDLWLIYYYLKQTPGTFKPAAKQLTLYALFIAACGSLTIMTILTHKPTVVGNWLKTNHRIMELQKKEKKFGSEYMRNTRQEPINDLCAVSYATAIPCKTGLSQESFELLKYWLLPIIDVAEKELVKVKDEYSNIVITPDYKENHSKFWKIYQREDLRGRHLELANLSAASLYNADFRGTLLQYASSKGLMLQGADLRGAQLQGADLQNAQLQGADLQDTQLQGANLGDAQLQGVDLQDTHLQGANLVDAQLQGADLRGIELQGADLRGTQLQGADLQGTQLQGVNLRGAQLQGANLKSTKLQGVYLRDAELQGANLQYAQLQGATLRQARLQGANLWGAKLQGADLGGAELQGADLGGALLQGADLSHAVLHGANLRKAELQGASLGGAELHGTVLGGTGLFATQFPPDLTTTYDGFSTQPHGWDKEERWASLITSAKLYGQSSFSSTFVITHLNDAKEWSTAPERFDESNELRQDGVDRTSATRLKKVHEIRRALACSNPWIAKRLTEIKQYKAIYDKGLKEHIFTDPECRANKIAELVYGEQ